MAQQLDDVLVEVVRDGEDARLDLPEEGRHVLVVKGQGAAQQGVQDHATGPNVDLKIN